MNATSFTRRASLSVASQRYSPTRSFLATPARIAIAGDWHADTDYGVAAIEHAATANTAESRAITKLFRYQVWMLPRLNSSW